MRKKIYAFIPSQMEFRKYCLRSKILRSRGFHFVKINERYVIFRKNKNV